MGSYSSNGQTVRNNNGRWFVEDNSTRQVRFVTEYDYAAGFADCVKWVQYFVEGLPRR